MPKKDGFFPRSKWGKGAILVVMGIILGVGLVSAKTSRLRFKTFSSFGEKVKQFIVKEKPGKGYDVVTSASIMVKAQKIEKK
ncbi:hypothetical protein HQ584_10860 [Patescibacteria group bacterium]|nr:hypothetical protein [Patescibacteria group bacterium]